MRIFGLCLGLLVLASNVHADIRGFCRVSPGFYRGGRPNATDMQLLADLGFRTVVSLQGGDYSGNQFVRYVIPLFESGERPREIAATRAAAEKVGLNYINLPINSLKPIDAAGAANYREALEIMRDPANQPALLSCAAGFDRTGLGVALDRIRNEGWSAEAAYDEWVAKGHTHFRQLTTYNLDRYFFAEATAIALARGEDTGPIQLLQCRKSLTLF